MTTLESSLRRLTYISITILVLVVAGAIFNIEQTKTAERNLNRKIVKLEKKVSQLEGRLLVPQISGIKSIPYDGSWLKIKDYTLIEKQGLLTPVRNPPKGWSIDNCAEPIELDSCLPFPWPEKYIKEHNHPFNPWSFHRNIEILVKLISKDQNSPSLQTLLNLLIKRARSYSEAPNKNGLFVVYKFAHNTGPHSVEAGWVSSYANGRMLQAYSLLYHHFNDPKYLEAAEEYFQAFTEINFHQKEKKPNKWFSYVDKNEYLWLEELPLAEQKKSHILNGHIQAIRGVYFYWMVTKSNEALKILKASLLTVHRYGNEYRVPGKINRYDLYQEYNRDYSPFRSISQQKFLYSITGEEYFKNLADDFATDMRWHK